MSYIGAAVVSAGASLGITSVASGLTALGSAFSIGSSLSNILGAQTKEEEREQKRAAHAVYQQKLRLLSEQKELGIDKATTGFQTGAGDVSQRTSSLYAKSGFATMNPIQKKMQDDMKMLFDTRQMQVSAADLSYRTGALSAEEAYEAQVSDIESQTPWYL